jgi:hypothetical protein
VSLKQNFFDAAKVVFGVDADGVVLGLGDVEGDIVFEEAKLFEALDLFELAGRQGRETLQGCAAVGIETEVLPVDGAGWLAILLAVEGDGRAREVEGAAIGGGDHFDGVGVGDVFGCAADFEGGHLHVRCGEGREQRGDVSGLNEGLVALDVEVNFGGDLLRDSEEAVGTAGEIGRGHQAGPAVQIAKLLDLGGVGGDDDLVETRASLGGAIDPCEQRLAGELAEDFAGQARGGQACGNDSQDASGAGVSWFGGEREVWDGRIHGRRCSFSALFLR